MNADLEELLEGDAESRRLVDALRKARQAHVAAGFTARVMSEVRAQRRSIWLSAPSAFAVAASLVALLSIGSIFFRPVPKPSLTAWISPPFTVRLAPYNPAEWYAPLICEEQPVGAEAEAEPLCTVEALAACRPSGR